MAISDITARTDEKARKGPPCSVCGLLESLPDTERQALLTLLGDTGWRYSSISRELLAEGYDIADSSLSRHARGDCRARTKLR